MKKVEKEVGGCMALVVEAWERNGTEDNVELALAGIREAGL